MSETNRAEQQAIAQCDSIVEMVANLDRKKAAEYFVRNLDMVECRELLVKNEIPFVSEESDNDLRERLADAIADKDIEVDDFTFDEDQARQTISEDPLSLEVRSGWVAPGDELKPEEFCLLLCTGGPAVRIIGDVNEHGELESPKVQYQDWGTPWTEYFPTEEQREALEIYIREFPILT